MVPIKKKRGLKRTRKTKLQSWLLVRGRRRGTFAEGVPLFKAGNLCSIFHSPHKLPTFYAHHRRRTPPITWLVGPPRLSLLCYSIVA